MALSESAMRIKFDHISDALFVQIHEVGRVADYTPEFYALVEEWFGTDVAIEYADWVWREQDAQDAVDTTEQDKANARASLTHATESRDA